VDIEFKNPLQIPISISRVSLICELSAGSDDMKSGWLPSVLFTYKFLMFLCSPKYNYLSERVIVLSLLVQMQVAQLWSFRMMMTSKI
jgi:hypothetical protein